MLATLSRHRHLTSPEMQGYLDYVQRAVRPGSSELGPKS